MEKFVNYRELVLQSLEVDTLGEACEPWFKIAIDKRNGKPCSYAEMETDWSNIEVVWGLSADDVVRNASKFCERWREDNSICIKDVTKANMKISHNGIKKGDFCRLCIKTASFNRAYSVYLNRDNGMPISCEDADENDIETYCIMDDNLDIVLYNAWVMFCENN